MRAQDSGGALANLGLAKILQKSLTSSNHRECNCTSESMFDVLLPRHGNSRSRLAHAPCGGTVQFQLRESVYPAPQRTCTDKHHIRTHTTNATMAEETKTVDVNATVEVR